MNIENEASTTRVLRKDQLLSEMAFLRYCNESNDSRVNLYGKTRRRIEREFLQAAEKEGFLKPLFTQEEELNRDGTKKIEIVPYYSHFQVYVIAQLAGNIINENGELQSGDSLAWQKEQKFRMISWGLGTGMSFTLNSDRRAETESSGRTTEMGICNYLHRFLTLLHTFDHIPDHSRRYDRNKGRYGSYHPEFQFDLENFKDKKDALLAKYDLDPKKLEILRVAVGYTATAADPLEKWFAFTQRLPQWRRDLLKGEALLAQDLYGFTDILAEFLSIVTDTPQPTLPDLIASQWEFGREEKEYATGTDIETLKVVLERLCKWLQDQENQKLLKDVTGKDELLARAEKEIERIAIAIDHFEKRYGRYGFERYVSTNDLLHVSRDLKSPIPLSAIGKDIIEDAKRMIDDSEDSAEEKEKELHRMTEFLITRKLDEIQRAIGALTHGLAEPLDNKRWYLEEQKKNSEHSSWWSEAMMSPECPKDTGEARKYFFDVYRPKKIKEYESEVNPLKKGSGILGGIANESHRVMCSHCRKNYVLLHQNHLDGRISEEAVCEECLGKHAAQKITGAEWSCEHCGTEIYKFANSNILNDVLRNTSNASVRLEYGRMTVRARCPNQKCREWNEQGIDWGWQA